MTSAAELFYNRRSRFGRSSSPPPISHHHQTRRHLRRDLSGCDPLPRSHHRHRRFTPPDRESISLDPGSSQASSGDVHAENVNRIRERLQTGSERLPGAVLLARERLLQRLRGVLISGSRRSNRIPASVHRSNITFEDDFRLADAGERETDGSRDWFAGTSPSAINLWRATQKRPPGLSQEALDSLHIGVFSEADKGEEGTRAKEVLECSICLDAFLEGDKLVCLPCGHRFHPCCLEPWVRSCGDCPYCRATICVTSCTS